MFSSPTKNIGCALDRTAVRCDIRQRNWRPPPKPPSCQLDWGFGLTLDRRGRGRFVCAGDTVLGSARTLPCGLDPAWALPLRQPRARDALREPPQQARLRALKQFARRF